MNVQGSFTVRRKRDGRDGQTVFKSIVFKRQVTKPEKPTDGSFSSPVPAGWSDGIPTGTDPIWMTTRNFSSDSLSPQQEVWTDVNLALSTANFRVYYSAVATPGNPTDNSANWQTYGTSVDIWMATSILTDGTWSDWSILKIRGENGTNGKDGVSIIITGNTVFTFLSGQSTPTNASLSLTANIYNPPGTPSYQWQYHNGSTFVDITNANSSVIAIAFATYATLINANNYLRLRVVVVTRGKTYNQDVTRIAQRDGGKGDKGDQGDKGNTGDKGDTGAAGVSPIVIEIINQNVLVNTSQNAITTNINTTIKVKKGETYLPYGSGQGDTFAVNIITGSSGWEGISSFTHTTSQASLEWLGFMYDGSSIMQGVVMVQITVNEVDYIRPLTATRVDMYFPSIKGPWKTNTQYVGSVYERNIVTNSQGLYFISNVSAGEFTNAIEPGITTGWEEYWQPTSYTEIIATSLLIAEMANIANFIFFQKKLVSQAADANNVPLLQLDGVNGYIQAVIGKIGMLNFEKDKLYSKNIEISDLPIESLSELINASGQTIYHQASWDDEPIEEVMEWNASSQNFTINKKSIIDFKLLSTTQGGEANVVVKLIEQCTNYSNASISVEYIFKNDDEVPFIPSGINTDNFVPYGWSATKTTPAAGQVRYMSKRTKPAGSIWGEFSIPRAQLSSDIIEGEAYRLDKLEEAGAALISVILEPGVYNISATMSNSYVVWGELHILGNEVATEIIIRDYVPKSKMGSDGSYTFTDATHYDYYKNGYGRETRDGNYGFRVRSTGFSKCESGTWYSIQL